MVQIYRAQFKASLAIVTQYRVYLVIWILSLIAEPIIYMTVWTLVTRENGAIGGYTGGDFAAYYITWMLVRHFAVTLSPDSIEIRIRQGQLSPMLLRPIHPVHLDIADNIGYKVVALPFVLVIMLGLALTFSPTFHLLWWNVLAFIPVLVLAYPIRFLSHWILGMVSFWTTRAASIFGLFNVMEIFLTGRLAPLVLLPVWIQVTANVSPFRWMIAFPVEVLLGKLSPQEVLVGVGVQIVWLALMIGLLRLVWHYGTRRYAAVGA
jgi:ABC-2 type transport system permease protein